MIDLPDVHDDEPPEEQPPGFRSWRSVYAFVIGAFVVIVFLLAIFTWTYA